jgi:hypothetical protein
MDRCVLQLWRIDVSQPCYVSDSTYSNTATLASYEPNLMADSGITLITFRPLPRGHISARRVPSLRETYRHRDCACRPPAIIPSWQ